MVSPNKRIEVEIPSDEIPGTTQRVVISMPLKRPLADKDDNSPKSKRHGFQYMSLAAKKALCEYKRDRPKASQNELRAFLEREFGVQKVPGSTMSSILANAGKYLSLDDSQATTGRLKLRPGNNQKMEEVLYSWYKKAVAEKVPITDAQIVAVARKIGERLKVPENFAYSYNWLSGFKIRMGIVSKANVTGRKIKSKVVGSKRLSSSGTCSPTTPSASIGNPPSQPVIDILPNIKIEPVECDFTAVVVMPLPWCQSSSSRCTHRLPTMKTPKPTRVISTAITLTPPHKMRTTKTEQTSGWTWTASPLNTYSHKIQISPAVAAWPKIHYFYQM